MSDLVPGVVDATRWSAEQVLALAPDVAAQKAARSQSGPRPWRGTGWAPGPAPASVWGLCQGSGANPYQTCVDLAEPAYRCSCPSRKFPCKHALGLLLLWSAGGVAEAETPEWVTQWHEGRSARASVRAASAGRSTTPSPRTRERRAERVVAGLDELDRWLADQVRSGLAGLTHSGYAHWETMAARLVDAQAPAAAATVRRLAGMAGDGTGERLLAELALLRLLVSGYRRLDELPPELAATVRSRVGLPVATEEVLATPRVRDRWFVLGARDEVEERLTVRRVWLRGAQTGRPALVLSFAAPGQALAADLVVGTVLDADLCFFPGAQPLRALVAQRHAAAVPEGAPSGDPVATALRRHAEALAGDPWLERWPVLLAGVSLVAGAGWHVVDSAGEGLALDPAAGDPWRLVAAAGGQPVTVAGEWSPAGLRPLTAWAEGRLVRA